MMGYQKPVQYCRFLFYAAAVVCLGQMLSFASAASPISEAERQKKEAEEPVNNAFAKALAGLNLKDKG